MNHCISYCCVGDFIVCTQHFFNFPLPTTSLHLLWKVTVIPVHSHYSLQPKLLLHCKAASFSSRSAGKKKKGASVCLRYNVWQWWWDGKWPLMEEEIHKKHTTPVRRSSGNSSSFTMLEFLNQFPPLLPLTQINSHLWRGRDEREEWDHLPETHKGKWRNCVSFGRMPSFLHTILLQKHPLLFCPHLFFTSQTKEHIRLLCVPISTANRSSPFDKFSMTPLKNIYETWKVEKKGTVG